MLVSVSQFIRVSECYMRLDKQLDTYDLLNIAYLLSRGIPLYITPFRETNNVETSSKSS